MLGTIKTVLQPVKRMWQAAPLLWRTRKDAELTRVLRSYVGWVPLCLFSEPVRWARMLAEAPRRHRLPEQRPHTFYVPDLPARSFGSPDEVSRILSKNAETIVREFEAVAADAVPSPSSSLLQDGSWNTLPLVRAAKRFDDNIAQFPDTWTLVERCPLPTGARGGVYFSILEPGTHIAPHCGPSNLKYRYHVTVRPSQGARIRSGSDWRAWEAGECLILDDSFEHEVIHDGEGRRVILIVDCWHPDLTADERVFLTKLHQCWA